MNAPLSYHQTDAGRRKEGYATEHHDCVVRALALLWHVSYKSAYEYVQCHGRRAKHKTPSATFAHILSSNFTLVSFPYPKTARGPWPLGQDLLVSVRGHVFAVLNGVPHDTKTAWHPLARVRYVMTPIKQFSWVKRFDIWHVL